MAPSQPSANEEPLSLTSLYAQLRTSLSSPSSSSFTLPSQTALTQTTTSLPTTLSLHGLGPTATSQHLITTILPSLNGSATSPHYYGFVTGGVFPIAEFADNIVSALDQNVQVHLPGESGSTTVEERAAAWMVELLDLGRGEDWKGKIFTTGATAGNVLGLACGREEVVGGRLEGEDRGVGVGELGMLEACRRAKVGEIQVLAAMAHSSLYKAAAVVGLGRASVKDVGVGEEEPWRMDLEKLETELRKEREGVVSIVVVGAGEVNTGRFGTAGLEEMKMVRKLCDKYHAWLHVDGAFGIFVRSLPATPEFASLIEAAAGLELADSIATDCHKMLNVPYDCGLFLTRSASTLTAVFQNPNAAYLSAGISSIPSPLNIGLENSRRFRAFPVYAVLLAYGREGLAEMFARQVRLARGIRRTLERDIEGYEVLGTGKPDDRIREGGELGNTHIIVIFRAKDEVKNQQLVKRINETRTIYVSGTKWDGRPACRFAVSTWKVEVEPDLKVIKEVLEGAIGAI